MRVVLPALLVVATGCGGGVDGTPIAPPATPEPEPPPETPAQVTGVTVAEVGQDFVHWTWDAVEGATGYEVNTFPAGTPPNERPDYLYVGEEPSFRLEGLEPGAAMEFRVRAVRETAGGRAVGPRAIGPIAETLSEPRECSDERERALAFVGGDGGLVAEWDGTPIRMDYLIHGFPSDVLESGYLLEQLDIAEGLADQIEEQLGYPILRRGGLVEEPPLPAVWGESFRDLDQLQRAPHRVLGVVFPMEHPAGQCVSWASPRNALVGWSLCRLVPPFWPDNPRLHNRSVLHELFHVFGFKHTPGRTTRPEGIGITMSFALDVGPPYRSATWNDIDALRCVFPEEE